MRTGRGSRAHSQVREPSPPNLWLPGGGPTSPLRPTHPSYHFCWPLPLPIFPPPSQDSCSSTAGAGSVRLLRLSLFNSTFQTLIGLPNAVWISVGGEGMVDRARGGPVGGGAPHPKAIYNSGCSRPAPLPLPGASSLGLKEQSLRR